MSKTTKPKVKSELRKELEAAYIAITGVDMPFECMSGYSDTTLAKDIRYYARMNRCKLDSLQCVVDALMVLGRYYSENKQ